MVGWIVAWWVVNFGDGLTTVGAIYSGRGREANAIPAQLVAHFGVPGALAAKLVGLLVVAVLVRWKWDQSRWVRWVAWLCTGLVGVVVVGNARTWLGA